MIEEKLKTTAILKTPKGTHFQYTLYIRYTIYDIYIYVYLVKHKEENYCEPSLTTHSMSSSCTINPTRKFLASRTPDEPVKSPVTT